MAEIPIWPGRFASKFRLSQVIDLVSGEAAFSGPKIRTIILTLVQKY
jgi:hypothetical protein